ncbi:Ankyrin-3 [Araneus ventricosus]|uniref:Ankyrin-3 n=1 Tax=Araneus ventricosus TaxID=182803 RepID=A0A4Y2WRA5_ARAVE|nr:Ankyrin-3 [Araneus ventricosus]GBO38752.1 Ankyrin-3 [Araneus ventricosus]GBO38980.1 Ankyrin-3 [Araneus ventricosus]GBO38986.1 Ankyrin-3 [Araneus ventricosus]
MNPFVNVLFPPLPELSALEDLNTNRITRILTTDFPQYFAIITRIRQEVHGVGPEGGMVSSTVVPQVQAIFPEGALTKKIRVGLQVNHSSDIIENCREPQVFSNHNPITTVNEIPKPLSSGDKSKPSKKPKHFKNKSRWLSRAVQFLWPKLDVFSMM